MLIGELAERSGVATKTIRYYEDVRLLPEPARTGGGYRDFDEDAAGRIGFIRAAQAIGLSLGETREILAFRDRGEAPCTHVASLIQRRATDLSERIATLEQMRRALQRLARRASTASRTSASVAAYCHMIEAR